MQKNGAKNRPAQGPRFIPAEACPIRDIISVVVSASLSLVGRRLYFWLGRLHCSMRSPVSAAAVRSQNARPGFREGGAFRAEWHQLPAVNGSEGERKRGKADGTAALDDKNKSISWSLQLSDFMNPPSRPFSRRHPRSNLHPKTRYVLESFRSSTALESFPSGSGWAMQVFVSWPLGMHTENMETWKPTLSSYSSVV
jgi:hypothetical protein